MHVYEMTQRTDRFGQRWVICPICVEEFHPDDLSPPPEGFKAEFWDVCKGCFPVFSDVVCWDEETGFAYWTHEPDDVGKWGVPCCRRCDQGLNWCVEGSFDYWGEWDECGQWAEWCGRPAEGPACMPVCNRCKKEIERSPALQKKYNVVVFEPYDGLTTDRFCSEGGGHDDEEWQWGGWTEPPAPADLEPSQIEHLIAELTAIRADLKNCARDTEGLMYENGSGGHHLRDFVARADTNGPPEDADARIWAARSRVGHLLDLLEPSTQKGT